MVGVLPDSRGSGGSEGGGGEGKDGAQRDKACAVAGTIGSVGESVFKKMRAVVHYAPILHPSPHPT